MRYLFHLRWTRTKTGRENDVKKQRGINPDFLLASDNVWGTRYSVATVCGASVGALGCHVHVCVGWICSRRSPLKYVFGGCSKALSPPSSFLFAIRTTLPTPSYNISLISVGSYLALLLGPSQHSAAYSHDVKLHRLFEKAKVPSKNSKWIHSGVTAEIFHPGPFWKRSF